MLRRSVSLGILALALAACSSTSTSGEGAASASTKEHPLIGTAGPDFSQHAVTNASGDLSLHALQGKVTIVDFWATWCEPCKKSFPKLQALHVKYNVSGLQIVGISEDDDKGGIPEFAKEAGAKFPIAWDADKAIATKWQPKSMPTTFILDRSGIVRFVHLGYHDGEELEIEKEIKSLM